MFPNLFPCVYIREAFVFMLEYYIDEVTSAFFSEAFVFMTKRCRS